MQILIDADACPKAVKEILYRAAEKAGIPLIVIANTHIRTPQVPFFKTMVVQKGFDLADDRIVEIVQPGDLVVTADIPLADRVVKKGGYALDPRGEFFTEDTISQRLAVRDLAHELREAGIETGGPQSFNPRDKQAFAAKLQMFLSKYHLSKRDL